MAMEICVRVLYYLGELLAKVRVVDMGSLGRDSFRSIGAVQSWVGEMGCLAVIAAPGLVQRVSAGTRYWQLGFLGDVAYISFVDFELRRVWDSSEMIEAADVAGKGRIRSNFQLEV